MTPNASSPFGDPGPTNVPDQGPAPTRDYCTGDIDAGHTRTLARTQVSVFRAPWTLLSAALLALAACVLMTYWLTNLWLTDPDAEFTVGTGVLVGAVLLGVLFPILALRTYNSGRIGLTVWAVGALVSLLHAELWPVALLATGAAVLAWLPPSSRWLF